MATYNENLNLFHLVDGEVTFAIPQNIPNTTTQLPPNADVIGNALNNRITGDASHNEIDGGAGADWMTGGQGDDTYLVDNAGDVVLEDVNGPGEGYDTVITSVSYILGAGVEKLQAVAGMAAINLTGNHEINTIIGNDGANVIDGGSGGADILEGKGGNDIYFADHNDIIREDRTGGIDQVFARADFVLGDHIENLTAIGSFAFNLTGNAQKNTILGNDIKNVINGKSGNDVLYGGDGRDTFVFDSALGSYKTDRKVNFDNILDFEVKDDTILLDRAVFQTKDFKNHGSLKSAFFTIGNNAKDANDYIIYNDKTGVLSFDSDGSGVKQAVEFAQLDKGLNLTRWDFKLI